MEWKKSSWILALLTAAVLCVAALPTQAVEKPVTQKVVAVVNGTVITQDDLDRGINRVQQRFKTQGKPISPSQLAKIKEQVLENLIDRELLYQESQKQGIKIEQKAVEQQFEKLKKRFPSEDQFQKAMARANLSEATIKQQIERGMAVQELVDREFVRKTTVSDKEAKEYYDSHQDLFKRPEQIRASHILIKVDSQASQSEKAEARKKIEEIQKKLKNGEDFAALARKYSQGPSKDKGGDLGYFRRGRMVKPFEETAFALKPGQVSDIVETKFGYHLIKVTDKKPASKVSFENIKERLKEYLKQQKIKEQIDQYVAKLKKQAKVERLLK